MPRHTPLYETHCRRGARMIDFAGWEMPVLYTSIVDEHLATRSHAALFDVSHMGEIMLQGTAARNFLTALIPTRMDRLSPGSSMYSVLCRDDGTVIDDLFIFMIADDRYYLCVNAGTAARDLAWLNDQRMPGLVIEDRSIETAKIDIQGPRAAVIASRFFNDPAIADLPRFHFIEKQWRGTSIMVSQTGYTGEHGYEFFLPAGMAADCWDALLESGRDEGLVPAGLGARDSLRLEAGYHLYGHELSDSITPIEAGLGWLVSSPAEYRGRAVLTVQKDRGAPRELVAFVMKDRGIAREGQRVSLAGKDIGFVTSGGFAPTLQKAIGLALVTRGSCTVGSEITIAVRDRILTAGVARRPLYHYRGGS